MPKKVGVQNAVKNLESRAQEGMQTTVKRT